MSRKIGTLKRLTHSVTCTSIFPGVRPFLWPTSGVLFVDSVDEMQGINLEDIRDHMYLSGPFLKYLVQIIPHGLPEDDPLMAYIEDPTFHLNIQLVCEELKVTFRAYSTTFLSEKGAQITMESHSLCHRLWFERRGVYGSTYTVKFRDTPNLYEVFRRLVDCLGNSNESILDLSSYGPYIAAACLDSNRQYNGFITNFAVAKHVTEVLELYPTSLPEEFSGNTVGATVNTLAYCHPKGAITPGDFEKLPPNSYPYGVLEDRKLTNYKPYVLPWFLNEKSQKAKDLVRQRLKESPLWPEGVDPLKTAPGGMSRRAYLEGEWNTKS